MVRLWITLAVLLAIVTVLNSSWFRGWIGEQITNFFLWLCLNKAVYHLVRNVTLPAGDGTTQIDHVVVSRFGVFVIETKNMSGAIYGSEYDAKWIQAFGRRKHQFMNPLRQNYKHVMTLAEVTGLPQEKFIPVVLFVGSAKLKTREKLPPSVLSGGIIRFIVHQKQERLSFEEVQQVLATIGQERLQPSLKTQFQHVQHVRALKAQNALPRESRAFQQKAAPATSITTPPAVPVSRPQSPKLPPLAVQSKPSPMPPPLPSLPPLGLSPSPSIAAATASAAPICPRCGKVMVLRVASKGTTKGERFWGCPAYPQCRAIVSIT